MRSTLRVPVSRVALAAAIALAGASAVRAAPSIDALRLDQIRVEGSHNSYRAFPSPRAGRTPIRATTRF